jgi:hypothetical protein
MIPWAKRKRLKPPNLNQHMCVSVTYQIDKAKGIIRTRCTGMVTIEEVIEHFHTLEQDPECCPDHVDVLLDLTEEITIPTKENLQDVAHEIRRIRGRVQFGALAIVACTDALFGMSRMLEVFAGQYFRETCVFRSVSEAEEWLGSQYPRDSAAD